MKIIICGAGKVGMSIASQLVNEGNDVTLIDMSDELIADVTQTLDVQGVTGFASHPNVLAKAGAKDADMVIAVTYADEVNMLVCQVASSLFRVPLKIARIRNQNYLNQKFATLFGPHHLPIDITISPEAEVARVIFDRLRVPSEISLTPFARGNIQIADVRVSSQSTIYGVDVHKIKEYLAEMKGMFLGLTRDEQFYIPPDEEIVNPGDHLYIAVDREHVQDMINLFGYQRRETKRFVIIGGGNIGLFVAEFLEQSDEDLNVKIIELGRERAEYVAERLSRTTIINGSAMDQSILEEANISHADIVIAVSNDDKVNILSSLIAKRFGCKRSVTLVSDATAYSSLVTSLGIDVLISPGEITISTILSCIRTGQIAASHALGEGKAEVIEVEVSGNFPIIGKTLAEIDIPEGVVIAMIMHSGEVVVPTPDTVINAGDRVIVFALVQSIKQVEKMFAVKFDYF